MKMNLRVFECLQENRASFIKTKKRSKSEIQNTHEVKNFKIVLN